MTSKIDIKDRFMPDGKTPKCRYCGQAMQNYVPTGGKFKGEVQHFDWVCDCERYPNGIVTSIS